VDESNEEIEEIRLRIREDPWQQNEIDRRARLRRDGERSLDENLAEGLALSDFLSTFTGVLRKG